MKLKKIIILSIANLFAMMVFAQKDTSFKITGNPIITHKYTADPAAMVYKDKVYLYTGHDVAPEKRNGYEIHDWTCFSSSDMINWTEHITSLSVKDFKWVKDDAWASQVIESNGKIYWYVAITDATIHGKAIGVVVAHNPNKINNKTTL